MLKKTDSKPFHIVLSELITPSTRLILIMRPDMNVNIGVCFRLTSRWPQTHAYTPQQRT